MGDKMEVKIESTTENKLLDRKEVEAFVHFDGATPPRKEIKSAICGKIGANPELVVLRSVASEFGIKRVRVSAHIYENADVLKRNEPEYITKREGMVEEVKAEKKEEEAAPAVKKEEAPKEEKKKEAPKEEKPKEAPKKEEKPAKKKEEKAAEKKEKPKPKTEDTKQETGKPETEG